MKVTRRKRMKGNRILEASSVSMFLIYQKERKKEKTTIEGGKKKEQICMLTSS